MTDAEWRLVEPLLPAPKATGRPLSWPLREIVNAIFYVMRDNFAILHLNILGAREVTDFNGTKLSEKLFAARYGIIGTPAIQFFSPNAADPRHRLPRDREVARMEALPEPQEFLAIFRNNLLPIEAPSNG